MHKGIILAFVAFLILGAELRRPGTLNSISKAIGGTQASDPWASHK